MKIFRENDQEVHVISDHIAVIWELKKIDIPSVKDEQGKEYRNIRAEVRDGGPYICLGYLYGENGWEVGHDIDSMTIDQTEKFVKQLLDAINYARNSE